MCVVYAVHTIYRHTYQLGNPHIELKIIYVCTCSIHLFLLFWPSQKKYLKLGVFFFISCSILVFLLQTWISQQHTRIFIFYIKKFFGTYTQNFVHGPKKKPHSKQNENSEFGKTEWKKLVQMLTFNKCIPAGKWENKNKLECHTMQ